MEKITRFHKFCRKCGNKNLVFPSKTFDQHTGKNIPLGVCPTNICGHSGVKHRVKNKYGLYYECINCGAGAFNLCEEIDVY